MLFTSIAESRSTIHEQVRYSPLPTPIALRSDEEREAARICCGTGAGWRSADPGSLADADFLVIADVDGRAGHSRIFLAAPVDEGDVRRIFADAITRVDLLEWNATAGSVRQHGVSRWTQSFCVSL